MITHLSTTHAYHGHRHDGAGRRYVVLLVLFSWVSWFLACPPTLAGLVGTVPGGAAPVIQAVAAHSHVGSANDVCCAVFQHVSVLQRSSGPDMNPGATLSWALLSVFALWAVLRLGRTEAVRIPGSPLLPPHRHRRSPSAGRLWPHAPPC